jgi:hypothetical protein
MDQNVSPISGDLLMDDLQDNSILDEVASLMGSEDTEELSFYINIEVDRQIPDEEICRKVKDFEIENIFLDDEIICPDTMDDDIYNIYDSLVRPEDLEDCD